MKPFDPFTATLEEASAQPDANVSPCGAIFRWGAAQDLVHRRARYEAFPIEGVAWCVRSGIVAPEWLALAFCRQYDSVLNYRVGTWDEAFGPAKPAGEHLSKLRTKRMVWAATMAHQSTTKEGREAIVNLCGLTKKQARDLLPAMRKNTRGHKPYKTASAAPSLAHDPFGIALKSTPKN